MEPKPKKNPNIVSPSQQNEIYRKNKADNVSRRLFLKAAGLGALSFVIPGVCFSDNSGLLEMTEKLNLNAAIQKRYYAHDAVLDKYGVIAPWYTKLNGQCDYRIRIAAETLKRYPWTTINNAVATYPHYVFTSKWDISSKGEITPVDPGDFMNGDLGQRSTSIFKGMADYYRYSGDPAAIAHITYMANYVLDYCLTPANHSWPNFPISVPSKGKAYGKADPEGMIQLDICASMGEGLLRAYQVTKNERWFEAAKHWGDLFAEKCNLAPNAAPWPRYANPESAKWKDDPRGNVQTGGVTMVLAFLDELIRLGYSGKNKHLETAREAGLRYLRDKLLPEWTLDHTWNFFFWDYLAPNQSCSITADSASYLIRNKDLFPNWRSEARNIMTLFLNHSSANITSGGDVYSGAWAYPESSSCCTRSLWYAPLMVGAIMAQHGVEADDELMRELAYRQMILQTYDVHENGVTEDNIDGGVLVNNRWFNIAHPWPLLWLQQAIGWLPEQLGASRENHLVRCSSVVDFIQYNKGSITYSTFDAPVNTVSVLRMSYIPEKILADGKELVRSEHLMANGYTVKKLPNGDTIVSIRHDGKKKIDITGQDQMVVLEHSTLIYQGLWTQETDKSSISGSIQASDVPGASVTAEFEGNQIRLIGKADQFGGEAEVLIDGVKQYVSIDFWNPALRNGQVLYYKNGLEPGKHILKIVAKGTANPFSKGRRVYIDAVQLSSASGTSNFPFGTGPTGAQRMIFGYKERYDYKDSKGQLWRPGTEVVTRIKGQKFEDTVEKCWMDETTATLTGTPDQKLYRFGYRAPDFWINVTVGPGKYDVRLGFAAREYMKKYHNGFDIMINDKTVVSNLNVIATAGGVNKVSDLIFRDIAPLNGIIQIRFKNSQVVKTDAGTVGDAFVQLVEVAQKLKGKSVKPISFS